MAANQLFGVDTMNAPWGLESREKLISLSCHFFNVNKVADHHKIIGKDVQRGAKPGPLTASDFLKYLEVMTAFPKPPNALRVTEMLQHTASAGVLVNAGRGNRGFAGLDDHYLYIPTAWEVKRDIFRLVPALGPEYLYKLCAPSLVHITGTKKGGDPVAGTGLVIDTSHILTCRHVVTDMEVDEKQIFQGQTCVISEDSIYKHPKVDVAVIQVEGTPLTLLKGALFLAPVVAQIVYTLGYPKLPGLRDASVTMQQGAVTNESVTSLEGESLFLYSAISRPGNSGGPVMSHDGYVVGLSIVDATGKYIGDEAFSPHYAGIPAQVVVEAVESLGLGIELPFEKYE